jgi:hypothetical protein
MASEYQLVAQLPGMTMQTVQRMSDGHISHAVYTALMPAKMYDGCTHPGCGRRHQARGYCHLHYERLMRTGTAEQSLMSRIRGASIDDHFSLLFGLSKTDRRGCKIWAGSKTVDRYARLSKWGKAHKAYRLAYEKYKGAIPVGMEVCHSCDNPSCVNPDHLFVGTAKDNALDRQAKGRGGHEIKRIRFRFRNPDGKLVKGVWLTQFCLENGLLQPKMSQVLNGTRLSHKGWTRDGR